MNVPDFGDFGDFTDPRAVATMARAAEEPGWGGLFRPAGPRRVRRSAIALLLATGTPDCSLPAVSTAGCLTERVLK